MFQQRLPPTTAGTPVAADVPPPLHRKVIASGEVEIGAALPPSGDPASAVSSPSPVPRCACGVSKDDLTKSGYKRHLLSCSAMKQYRLATQAARKRAASASPAQPSPDINLAAETPGDNTQEPDVEMLPPSIVDCPPPPAAPPSSLAAPGANMVLAPPAPIAAPAAAAHEAAPSAPSVPAALCSFVGVKEGVAGTEPLLQACATNMLKTVADRSQRSGQERRRPVLRQICSRCWTRLQRRRKQKNNNCWRSWVNKKRRKRRKR